MPTSEELTDNYLAALLVRDAENVRNGTGTAGSRPRNAPKPNVRFLKSIIRDTTSHNTALLEKEERLQQAHARSQLRALDKAVAAGDERPAKRRREERPDRWSVSLSRDGLVGDKHSVEHKRRDKGDRMARLSTDKRDHDCGSRRDDGHRHKRSRDPDSRSSKSQRTGKLTSLPSRAKRSSSYGSRSHSSRSKSPIPPHSPASRTRHKSGQNAHPTALRTSKPKPEDDDSDPLEDIIGPRPAGSIRGRGRLAGASGIDARFADPAYDPRADTHDLDDDPCDDNEDDDWDKALSGLRERFKRRTINADRLLAAGFDENDVKRWKEGSTTKTAADDIDNVVWQKRGEAREWDRGKILNEHGVTTQPDWASKSP